MPSVYDNPLLQEARNTSQQATEAVVKEQQAGATLPDMLRDALTKKFSTNNPLVQEREGALTNYLNASTQAPLDVTAQSAGGNAPVVYNPTQQANLMQQQRSAPLARLSTINDLLGLQTGSFADIIGAASRAHGANVAGLQGRAGIARQNYQDVLGETQGRAAEEAARAQAEAEARSLMEISPGSVLFDPVTGQPVFQAPYKPDSGGGSSIGSDLLSLLIAAQGGNNQQNEQPTEPTPGYTPRTGEGTFSPGGQWVFEGGRWNPW